MDTPRILMRTEFWRLWGRIAISEEQKAMDARAREAPQAQGHAADVAHPGETKQPCAALASGNAVWALASSTHLGSAQDAELVALRVRHLRPARVLLNDHRAKHHQPGHLRGWVFRSQIQVNSVLDDLAFGH
jgi:hypothetical protein